MKILKMISCAALAAMLIDAAAPAPAAAQIGGFIKRKVKDAVVGSSGTAAAPRTARTAPAGTGPQFTNDMPEITPDLLDRYDKGLAAEMTVQAQIDRLLGKLLPPAEYEKCKNAVMRTPEAQQIYMSARDLINGDASQENLRKSSEELARRFDKIVRPKCGLDTQAAQRLRDQYADSLAAAAPAASGLSELQLTLLKERIIPFCSAVQAPAAASSEVRIATSSPAIFWVYTAKEIDALKPRCAKYLSAFQRKT